MKEFGLRQRIGFILAPVAFFSLYTLPLYSANPSAHKALALFITVVILWVTEAIPLAFTALLIPFFAIVLGIANSTEAFSNFSNPIIFLFFGSFVIAKAMSYHGLDKRIAILIISRKWVNSPSRILFSIGAVTAFLSMWISNTATTAMIYLISLGIYGLLSSGWEERESKRFGLVLMLISAYAASIGGIGTPVGTPPNLIAIGFLEKFNTEKISFFQWMLMTFPYLLVLFLVMFFTLRGKGFDGGIDKKGLNVELKSFSRGELNVLAIFCVVVFLWIFPGIASILLGDSPFVLWFGHHLPESSVALLGAILTILIPINWKRGEFTLPFKEAISIDWGTLLLFGGGLTLGDILFRTGLAGDMGMWIKDNIPINNIFVITIIFCSLTVFLTEFTSNTAAINIMAPIIISTCIAFGVDPLIPVVTSTIGASLAFVLPVSTPPNAIIYSTGFVPLSSMLKYGILIDLAGIAFSPIFVLWLKMVIQK
jgi:sodium-dependent dicarboxylate transporter 2/3/5